MGVTILFINVKRMEKSADDTTVRCHYCPSRISREETDQSGTVKKPTDQKLSGQELLAFALSHNILRHQVQKLSLPAFTQ